LRVILRVTSERESSADEVGTAYRIPSEPSQPVAQTKKRRMRHMRQDLEGPTEDPEPRLN